jgi:hypothetical protein
LPLHVLGKLRVVGGFRTIGEGTHDGSQLHLLAPHGHIHGRSTSHWPTSRHRLGQPDEAHFRACGCRWGAEVLGWKEVTGEKLSRPSPQSPFRDSQPTPPRYGNVCTPTAKCEPT